MHYQNRKVFTTTWISIQTFLAGAINVYAVFMLDKTISHHTGSISKAAIALANGNRLLAFHLVSYLMLFFVGAFFSGLTTYKRNRGVRLLHSVYPIMFGTMIIVGALLKFQLEDLLRIMAFGMGLQNGTYIRFNNMQIRTTHMTGYLTDAAVSFGKALRGSVEERKKALFISYSIAMFFLGGLFGAWMQLSLQAWALLIIGLLYILVGILVFYFHPKTI